MQLASHSTPLQPTAGIIARLAALAPVWLALLAALTYWPSLDNGFHLDDYANFVEVQEMHVETLSLDTLGPAMDAALLDRRPIPNASLVIDWWRGGGDPVPFQQTNIVIHVLCALAVFAFVLTMLVPESRTRQRLIALGAAAIWAVHPIQVQAVTYIVQRMASMVALFFLASVVCYIAARRTEGFAKALLWWALTVAFAACALMSKENALMLPPALILAEYGLCRRPGAQFRYWFDRYLWLAVVVLTLYVALDLFVIQGPVSVKMNFAYIFRDFTMEERILTQPRVLLFHLGQLLWPLPDRFSLEHDFQISQGLLSPPSTLAAIVFLAVWLVGGLIAFFSRHYRIIGFLALFPLVVLIPESTVHGLEMVFEHRMYLPSAALVALLALAVQRTITAVPGTAQVCATVTVLVIGLLAAATVVRLPEWRDEVTLGQANIRNAPTAWRPRLSYGIALKRQGRHAEATEAIVTGARLAGDDRKGLEIAAVALSEMDRLPQAIALLSRLQELNVKAPYVRQQKLLGQMLLRCGRPAEARQALAVARQSAPWDTEVDALLDLADRIDRSATVAAECARTG